VKLTVYLVTDGPDFKGRHTFWGFWWGLVGRKLDQFGVRGQIFRTNVADHVRIAPLDGRRETVKVLDLREMEGVSQAEATRRCQSMVREAALNGRMIAC
jgi:hypothetical protein